MANGNQVLCEECGYSIDWGEKAFPIYRMGGDGKFDVPRFAHTYHYLNPDGQEY